MFKSSILQELDNCGFIKSISKEEKLDDILLNKQITVYGGFDLTAQSLHVGNLMQIMLLRKFLKHGHKIILLLGGATTKIGDPSGKDETRRVLTDEEIELNKQGIINNFSQFIDINSDNVIILNNSDWLCEFSYIDFLKNVGKHFTVNRMLAMESVKQRLEKQNPMNFVEFNYMLMQSYDFAYLNKKYNCILQVGGSDQWGNITEGMELCSRMHNLEGFALTSPLITKSDGTKMGKSLQGAISLNQEITSAFDYFQYFRNISDEDVIKMLKIYTDLESSEIQKLSSYKGKEVNEAKKILAFEVLKLRDGEDIANSILKEAESIFINNDLPDNQGLTIKCEEGASLLKLMLENKIITSMAEGKRLLNFGSIKLNEEKILEVNYQLSLKGNFKLSIGKKKHYKIIIT
jgi:tyrosyl-tRNA synthetase